VDIDGLAGETSLLRISDGEVPATLEFVSGRSNGGRGLLYAIPAGAVLRTTIERSGQPKQELRFQAKGAQTVLPPSRHREGGLYAWTSGHSPWDIKAAVAPGWLLDQLRVEKVKSSTSRPGAHVKQSFSDGTPIPEGARNSTLTSIAGGLRRVGLSVEAMYAALLIENSLRCRPPLEDSEVRTIAESVGRYPPSTRLGRAKLPATVRTQVEV
jgi:putative DNA primase/helicase